MENTRFNEQIEDGSCSTISVSIPLCETGPLEMVQFLYHEIFIDLQKKLIGICKISRRNNVDGTISFVIEGIVGVSYILKIIRKSYRYIYEIEVPLCLYSLKNEIYKQCSNIANKNKSMLYVQITNKVALFVGGRFGDVMVCRIQIYKLLEEFMGFKTKLVEGKIDSILLLRRGVKVLIGSLINSDIFLLSTRQDQKIGFSDAILPEKDLLQWCEILSINSNKYTYLLLYKKYVIEDILSMYSTYLSELEYSKTVTKIMFVSLSKCNLKKTLDKFNEVYNSIVSVRFSRSIYQRTGCLIILDHYIDNKCTVIGEIAKITEAISGIDGMFEAIMDVEPNVLDFLCGKKNGKIIKIMNIFNCVIKIIEKKDFKRSCLWIKGEIEDFSDVISAIINEFPVEITFNINEKHHKRIIGYGGKNIQNLMKKHGVYIKFMSHFEMKEEGLEHNVIIKTPKKNTNGLYKMRDELIGVIEKTPCENNDWVKTNRASFYWAAPQEFNVLFDKFLVREKLQRIYFYKLENTDLVCSNASNLIVLTNGQVFFCSTIKSKGKCITATNWLTRVPVKKSLFYIINVNGIRSFDTLWEGRNKKLVVVDSRFLI